AAQQGLRFVDRAGRRLGHEDVHFPAIGRASPAKKKPGGLAPAGLRLLLLGTLYLRAASTALFAITVIRWARYSGLACRSLLRPSAFTLMFATDSGANFAASAFSISAWRKALGPAPVTATRMLPPKSATNTPTIAKRDAGFLNFM